MISDSEMIEPGGVATIRSRSAWAPLLVWMGIVAIALGLAGLIVSAPLARSANHQSFAFTIYHAFSYACHQLPERSFYLAGYPYAVCARCTGLYVGFAAAALIYPLMRALSQTDTPARRWLLLAALPMVFDVGLDLIGVWRNTHLSRIVTGLLLGAVAAFYVIPGLIDLLRVLRNTPRAGADVVWPSEIR